MEEIKRRLSETWFAWMGGFGDNDEPEKFHIHIVVRTPNGNGP